MTCELRAVLIMAICAAAPTSGFAAGGPCPWNGHLQCPDVEPVIVEVPPPVVSGLPEEGPTVIREDMVIRPGPLALGLGAIIAIGAIRSAGSSF